MTGRTALVTGASRGIGLGIARRLAAEGYSLTLAARREPGLLDAAAVLRAQGADVHTVVTNLAQEKDITNLIAEHGATFGALDLLVLNGGVGAEGTIAELSMKTYDLVLNVNLRAQFQLVKEALPLLRKSAVADRMRGAKIVALASITGVIGERRLSAYGASKAGLISLCETVTLEESPHGVTATALCPGYVDTDMTEGRRDTIAKDAMLTTADVAELVLAVSRLSAHAVVPSIVLTRAGDQLWRA